MNARSALIKNETVSSGIPRSLPTLIDLDLIMPEYTHPLDFSVFAPARVFGRIQYIYINIYIFYKNNFNNNSKVVEGKIYFSMMFKYIFLSLLFIKYIFFIN